MIVFEEECEAIGADTKEVKKFVKRMSKLCQELASEGFTVFCGGRGGVGQIRYEKDGRKLIIAELDGSFDGGDETYYAGRDGLIEGE